MTRFSPQSCSFISLFQGHLPLGRAKERVRMQPYLSVLRQDPPRLCS